MDLKSIYLPIEIVLNVIKQSLPKHPNVILPPEHPITQTLLSFTLVCHETHRVASRYLRQHCVYLSEEWRLRSLLHELPYSLETCQIPALLFAPYEHTISDQPKACWTRALFNYTSPFLKRLIVDIPLRSLYPVDDRLHVRSILREGFKALVNLEEFVSTQDELFLDTEYHVPAPAVWKSWPKLKRLALYNVDVSGAFFKDIASMPELETLVLTRADGLRDVNMKKAYFAHTQKPLKVLLVNVEIDQILFGLVRRGGWDRIDPLKKLTIMTLNVPTLYEVEDAISVCQSYVRTGAEMGTLWAWEGEVIQHPPKPNFPLHVDLPN